jgi:hypothetical protein
LTTYRLMDGVAGRPGTGSSGTQPPAAPTAYSGDYLAGTAFSVTAFSLWFQGYWWWVPPGGDTGAQTFALWQLTETSNSVEYALVPGTSLTSGALTAGQWNYVPLTAPAALGNGITYLAATGYVAVNGFPLTVNQFGSGQPYSGGIVNGPLYAYSDLNGTVPIPYADSVHQGLFGTSTADASLAPPLTAFDSGNFWVDVQVSDAAPADAAYQLWPSQPYAMYWVADSASNFTLGTEFSLSQACTLDAIWFYSPAGVTQLPTECGIWNAGTTSLVAGTDNASPSWSGAAGSGWVSCSYAPGTILQPAVNYKVAVFNGAASPVTWNAATALYWSTGPGSAGITSGPLAAPDTGAATSPGQSTYNAGTPFTFPATNAGPYNYWVDVQVTPYSAPAQVTYSMRMFP